MADVDHAKRALEMLADVHDEQATERGLLIAEAQVYATLALVEVLRPLAERLAHPLVPVETKPPPIQSGTKVDSPPKVPRPDWC